jgi:hypothetical protein
MTIAYQADAVTRATEKPMDENSIKQAIELLQKARNILEDAWLADDSIDSAGIVMATEQLDDLIKFVGELIAPVIAPAESQTSKAC